MKGAIIFHSKLLTKTREILQYRSYVLRGNKSFGNEVKPICNQHYSTKAHVDHSIPSTMAVWQAFEHGGKDKLMLSTTSRVPPIEGPNDVLVEIHAASMNPIDVAMLGGYGQSTLSLFRMLQKGPGQTVDYPITYGRDFSGVVVATGQGVKNSNIKPGDEVFGCVSPFSTLGTHGQYTVTQDNYLAKKPESFSHIEAASFPYCAMTTWTALHTVGGLTSAAANNRRILVLGGAGGIGTFAIQLLKAWGAHVTCTAGSVGVDKIASLGCDVVLDYQTVNVKEELQQMPQFDFIFDCYGADDPDIFLVYLKKDNSKFVTLKTPILKNNDSFGVAVGLLRTAATLVGKMFQNAPDSTRSRWALFKPNTDVLNIITDLKNKNRISAVVDKVFPFSNLPEAYSYLEQRNRCGKTVIDMDSS